MSILLYDLCAEDEDRRFSPFTWRIKMALNHKGLDFETEPVRFGTMEKIAFSGHDRVPVLVDGDRTVVESWDIACYLEETYPDRPSLFGGEPGRGASKFINGWVDLYLMRNMMPLYILDIFEHIHPDDRGYFRESREARFGRSLEAVGADPAASAEVFYQALAPLRATLTAQPFVSGDEPAHPDYIVFGSFIGPRAISPTVFLAADDPIYAWRDRMLDLFGGYARGAKGFGP